MNTSISLYGSFTMSACCGVNPRFKQSNKLSNSTACLTLDIWVEHISVSVEIRSVQVRKMHGVSGIYRLRKNSDPPAPQNGTFLVDQLNRSIQ